MLHNFNFNIFWLKNCVVKKYNKARIDNSENYALELKYCIYTALCQLMVNRFYQLFSALEIFKTGTSKLYLEVEKFMSSSWLLKMAVTWPTFLWQQRSEFSITRLNDFNISNFEWHYFCHIASLSIHSKLSEDKKLNLCFATNCNITCKSSSFAFSNSSICTTGGDNNYSVAVWINSAHSLFTKYIRWLHQNDICEKIEIQWLRHLIKICYSCWRIFCTNSISGIQHQGVGFRKCRRKLPKVSLHCSVLGTTQPDIGIAPSLQANLRNRTVSGSIRVL